MTGALRIGVRVTHRARGERGVLLQQDQGGWLVWWAGESAPMYLATSAEDELVPDPWPLAPVPDEQLIGELARRGRWTLEHPVRRIEVRVVEAGTTLADADGARVGAVAEGARVGAVTLWGRTEDLAGLEEGTAAVLEITGGPR